MAPAFSSTPPPRIPPRASAVGSSGDAAGTTGGSRSRRGGSNGGGGGGGGIVFRLILIMGACVLLAIVAAIRLHPPSDSPGYHAGGGGKKKQQLLGVPPPRSGRRVAEEIEKLQEEFLALNAELNRLSAEARQLDEAASAEERRGAVERAAAIAAGTRREREERERRSSSAALLADDLKTMKTEGKEEGRLTVEALRPAGGSDAGRREPAAPIDRHPMDREVKKWWIPHPLSWPDPSSEEGGAGAGATPAASDGAGAPGSIIPIDLSVNHLQLIDRADGSPNAEGTKVLEEFLPVVTRSDVSFRWRSEVRTGSRPSDSIRTTAYRIVVRRAGGSRREEGEADDDIEEDDGSNVWDSGKVDTPEGLPDVVRVDNAEHLGRMPPGSVIEWRVTAWDSHPGDASSGGPGRPSTSGWAKFAIGPEPGDWTAEWISHPLDLDSFDPQDSGAFWKGNKNGEHDKACANWERRKQLPVFRAKLPALGGDRRIKSALLVASGLGSFRASFDGVPLSSSGPLDPPLTDYAARVSYRGFDVTEFLSGDENAAREHVLGISMGSGWWDHRPIGGSFIRLFYLPRGAVTCIAQLYVTYESGESEVLMKTSSKDSWGVSSGGSGWQVAKGHLRESSLFTGEYVDLGARTSFRGWDTREGWANLGKRGYAEDEHAWVRPMKYESDTTYEAWRTTLHMKSGARPQNVKYGSVPEHRLSPIGRLIPNEIPPVLPVETLEPDEVHYLGNGRWLFDFAKGVSGMLRFESGLPEPIVPEAYPRGHTVSTLDPDESFITVVYGDSIELMAGDINLPVSAGMGLHDGGPKHRSKKPGDAENKGGPCYPKDHHEAGSLLQRDVYILPKAADRGSFADARQSHFTTHSFRFAEVCCTAEPPSNVRALAYRTAFSEWGSFSSSNIRINGGYELVKNAMASNMLSVQSDCPHREKIQYGGDISADSPASLHLYDMSAFYRKAIRDWGDQQWKNGAYAGTSSWMGLNDYAAIGHGSGETVWASAPVVMTARHMQHYGDIGLLEETFDDHARWFDFLHHYFDEGMKAKGYDENLKGYTREGSGLGDWLTFRGRDTWLMHQGFYMATARCVAYLGSRLGGRHEKVEEAAAVAREVEDRIARLYTRDVGAFLPPEQGGAQLSPGPEMGLYARIVPGENRCQVLRRYFERKGHTWPGSDEMVFLREWTNATEHEMIASGEVTKRGKQWAMGWSQWYGFNEGIFAVRYALKTLSDNGFHNLALSKANGFGCGTFEYMLSHNATTHWESWWRSEDLYSHNHPMLGATAEWMVSAVAGVSLHPTTTGGKRVLFWPRFPNSAKTITWAGATQGTRRGDFSIAWRFEGLPDQEEEYDSATVRIHIRLFVPPDGLADFRLPEYSNGEGVDSTIKYSLRSPDVDKIRSLSLEECESRRSAKMGFGYNWEFDREAKTWARIYRKKTIGTACESFLFHPSLSDVAWSAPQVVQGSAVNGLEVALGPGMHDIMVDEWQLQPEVKGTNEWRVGSIKKFYEGKDIGPYCSDFDTFDWDVEDASYLI